MMKRIFGVGKSYRKQEPSADVDAYDTPDPYRNAEDRPRPAAVVDIEQPKGASWAGGSAAIDANRNSSSRFDDVPLNADQHVSTSEETASKVSGSSSSTFHVVASQGYGHADHHWEGQGYQGYPPYPSGQYPAGHVYPPVAPSQVSGTTIILAEKKRKFAWLLPMVVVVACTIVFIVEMYVNNCPHNVGFSVDGTKRECVIGFLGRLSFQPLKENPLFGPSTRALLDMGALESDRVTHRGQGWRLLTCMWLHAGVIHLVCNLLGIWFIGLPLEREFGALRVGVIYLLSGFGGSVLSALFLTNQVSVGASGALFGLIGATLAELIINWSRYSNRISALLTIVLLIAINLILGLMPYVDNFAHIGGLITGTLLGFALLVKPSWAWEQQVATGLSSTTASRNTQCQKITRIVCLLLVIAGFIVAIVLLFGGVDANKSCSWCHYLNCVPTSAWECPTSSNAQRIVCRAISNPDGSGSMVCSDSRSTPVANIGSLSQSELQSLCSSVCG